MNCLEKLPFLLIYTFLNIFLPPIVLYVLVKYLSTLLKDKILLGTYVLGLL